MTLSSPAPEPTATPRRIDRIEGEMMVVNSYLIHGPEGVIVVDAQLTTSDAAKVHEAVVASGLDLAGIVITHPHPDHYAGAGLLAPAGAPIVATPSVDTVIRRDDAEKDAIVGPMMGDQWPSARRFPDTLVEPGATLTLGGLSLRVTETGSGESYADTQWWLDDRTVFVGDVAYNGMHAYLADAQHVQWLQVLERLDTDLADDAVLCPGHGVPAGKGVLTAQRRYIEAFVAAVVDHAEDDRQTRQAAVVERMRGEVDDERLLFLMELSIDPVHAALKTSG
jgi:glyoxylase-like metal-dependent hydrolase (beta-lactamase superfamily II)